MANKGYITARNFLLDLTGIFGARTIQNFGTSGTIIEHGYVDQSNGEVVNGLTESTVYDNPNRTYLVNVYVPINTADENFLQKVQDDGRSNGIDVMSGTFTDKNSGRVVTSGKAILKETANVTISPDGNESRMFTFHFADSIIISALAELIN